MKQVNGIWDVFDKYLIGKKINKTRNSNINGVKESNKNNQWLKKHKVESINFPSTWTHDRRNALISSLKGKNYKNF